jgi:hypothetical protein
VAHCNSTARKTLRSRPALRRSDLERDVGEAIERQPDLPRRLLTLARRAAVFCQHAIARMAGCRSV